VVTHANRIVDMPANKAVRYLDLPVSRIVFGVAHRDGDTLRLLSSSSSSSPELSVSWSVLLLFASLLFATGDMAAPIALRQRACRSKFSCRPQRSCNRSCSVGAAKRVGHVCDSTCSAVRRCAGPGWRRARMNFLAVKWGAKVR